jgi:hypothetical protein
VLSDLSGSGSSFDRVRNHIRWWVLGPCLFLLIVGIGLLAFHVPQATKYFVSGALVGVGSGGALAEISSAFERRELRERIGQLREEVVAKCRLVYRIGEFFFSFCDAVEKDDEKDSAVVKMLFLAELLGVRTTLQIAIRDARGQGNAALRLFLREKIEETLVYAGQHLLRLFRARVRHDCNPWTVCGATQSGPDVHLYPNCCESGYGLWLYGRPKTREGMGEPHCFVATRRAERRGTRRAAGGHVRVPDRDGP